MKTIGWIYVMRNKAMPGLFKIGFTMDDPRERANQLSSPTGVPMPFEVVCAIKTRYPAETESYLHEQLSRRRVNASREFFWSEVLVQYDSVDEVGVMATEAQENEWIAMEIKHAARMVSAEKQLEKSREKVRRIRNLCAYQHGGLWLEQRLEILKKAIP